MWKTFLRIRRLASLYYHDHWKLIWSWKFLFNQIGRRGRGVDKGKVFVFRLFACLFHYKLFPYQRKSYYKSILKIIYFNDNCNKYLQYFWPVFNNSIFYCSRFCDNRTWLLCDFVARVIRLGGLSFPFHSKIRYIDHKM